MGLSRFASRRHPHVVVMAPALTESGQTQSFASLPNILEACEFKLVPKPKNKSQELGIAVYNIDKAPPNGKNGKRASSPLRPLGIPPSGGDSSMNFGSPMGDQPGTMCQLKSASACSLPVDGRADKEIDNLPFIKEKDMEQYLEQMPPNVDELMRVISTMDTESQDNVEFPLSTAEIANFEKELLLNPDEVMSNFTDEPPDSAPDPRLGVSRDKEDEVRRRDWQLERQHSRLLRRMKKLEAREVARETAAGLAGVLDYAYRLARPDAAADDDKEPRTPTRADMDKFTDKLHCSAHSLAQTATRFRPGIRYFGSGSVESPLTADPLPGSVLPKLNTSERDSLSAVANQLSTQLGMADAQFDSDATDSSSGGDSCDENVNYNNNFRNFLSIKKRAFWRWQLDRSAVASRWTWLTSAINDLDFKIRTLSDQHKKYRLEKTPVSLRNEFSTPIVSVNGYHGALPGAGHPKADCGPNGTVSSAPFDPAAISTCSRTEPFVAKTFRKRDLIRWENLHLRAENINHPTSTLKILRPASTRCWCIKPAHCLLCTGRTDATQPKGWPSVPVASVQERIAALDPSYHPVLSFPDDVSLSLHLDSVMRLNEWQTRINRCSYKYSKYNKYPKEKNNSSLLRLKKEKQTLEHKRKIHKHAAELLSAKILKKKLTAGQRKRRDLKSLDHGPPIPPIKIKKARKISSKSGGESGEDGDLYVTTVSAESGRASPELSNFGVSQSGFIDRYDDKRRGREDSFDINNIVIPYSMAATTRVEMIPYKEIPTPKWRVMHENGEECALHGELSDEDVSEQAVQERHYRCEEAERKKFMSYIKLPLASRGRANRRTDSRAESSGANTPDPMSPMNLEHGDSPLATPPATPQGVDETCGVGNSNARRRTISSSRTVLREKLERAAAGEHEQHFILDAEDEGTLPESPSSSSTISALEGDEPDDPNDPEWRAAEEEDEEDLCNRTRR